MKMRQTIVTALSALVLIALSARLPISETIATKHTGIGLFRKGLDQITGEKSPTQVRVLLDCSQSLREPLHEWLNRQPTLQVR